MAKATSSGDDSRQTSVEITQRLEEVIDLLRTYAGEVADAKAQVLFETSAEVLIGLKTAHEHYAHKTEAAMD